MSTPRRSAAVALGASAALLLVPVLPAHAAPGVPGGGSDTITASGVCSAGSRWFLGARAMNRGIVIGGRIVGSRATQWRVSLTHNGQPVVKGARRPGRSGLMKARTPNLPGIDTYTVTATNRSTGESCSGTLVF